MQQQKFGNCYRVAPRIPIHTSCCRLLLKKITSQLPVVILLWVTWNVFTCLVLTCSCPYISSSSTHCLSSQDSQACYSLTWLHSLPSVCQPSKSALMYLVIFCLRTVVFFFWLVCLCPVDLVYIRYLLLLVSDTAVNYLLTRFCCFGFLNWFGF